MKNIEQTLLIPPDAARIKQSPVMAINPSRDEIEIAEIVSSQAVIPQEASSSLPKTGRSLPPLASIGWRALGGQPAFECLREG
jgi:hypothetical protein